MSHEIRTPMTVIMGSPEYLAPGCVVPEHRKIIGMGAAGRVCGRLSRHFVALAEVSAMLRILLAEDDPMVSHMVEMFLRERTWYHHVQWP